MPLTDTRPRSGASRPPNRCSSVLLPQPEGPQRATDWPSIASKFTPFRTSIVRHTPAVRRIQAAKQMQQRTLAAARRAAKSYRLAFNSIEIHTLENLYCPVVITLPHVLDA